MEMTQEAQRTTPDHTASVEAESAAADYLRAARIKADVVRIVMNEAVGPGSTGVADDFGAAVEMALKAVLAFRKQGPVSAEATYGDIRRKLRSKRLGTQRSDAPQRAAVSGQEKSRRALRRVRRTAPSRCRGTDGRSRGWLLDRPRGHQRVQPSVRTERRVASIREIRRVDQGRSQRTVQHRTPSDTATARHPVAGVVVPHVPTQWPTRSPTGCAGGRRGRSPPWRARSA